MKQSQRPQSTAGQDDRRRTVKTSLAFSPEFAARLRRASEDFGFKSMSEMIETLFTQYFDKHKVK